MKRMLLLALSLTCCWHMHSMKRQLTLQDEINFPDGRGFRAFVDGQSLKIERFCDGTTSPAAPEKTSVTVSGNEFARVIVDEKIHIKLSLDRDQIYVISCGKDINNKPAVALLRLFFRNGRFAKGASFNEFTVDEHFKIISVMALFKTARDGIILDLKCKDTEIETYIRHRTKWSKKMKFLGMPGLRTLKIGANCVVEATLPELKKQRTE